MYDIICVGSSTVDVFAKTQFSELIKIMSRKGEEDFLAYPTGSKILVNDLEFTTGGGGTNVSACFTKLGLKTAYLGCIGNDENGDFIIGSLRQHKIDTSLVVRKKGISGYSLILDSMEHDRTILAYKGLNDFLNYKDIKLNKLHTKWFYFSTMLGKSFKAQVKLAKYAEKNGIKIIFNPSSYLAEKGQKYLKEILSRTEIIVLNKEEAGMVVGEDTIDRMGSKLSKLGPNYVVITDGRRGAFCYHEGFIYFAKTHDIKIVETTGAGDAFAASFLAGLVLKDDISWALKFATTNAESVISHHGAKHKLLTYRQVLGMLKLRPVKVNKKKAKL